MKPTEAEILFLENLVRQYGDLRRDLSRSQISKRSQNDSIEIEFLDRRISQILQEISNLKSELSRLQRYADAGLNTEDCMHLQNLLKIHRQVIQILEIEEAKQGSMFHYSKTVELEERRSRAAEIKEQIQQNCR